MKNNIEKLEEYKDSFKTALMMPIEEYIKYNKSEKETPEAYNKYSPYDELFGLFLSIKNHNLPIFNYLWDENGILWNESHLFPVLEEIIENKWVEGMRIFFVTNKTIDIYNSMYPSERKIFYSQLSEICSALYDDDEDETSSYLLDEMLRSLVLKPYTTISILYLFKYFHYQEIDIMEKDIKPEEW